MRRLACVLALTACQAPGSGNEGGLVVVSDTAQMGPPPVCEDAPTSGESGTGESGGESSTGEGSTGEAVGLSSGTGERSSRTGGTRGAGLSSGTGELSSRTGGARAAGLSSGTGELSSRTGGARAVDPGTAYCAAFTSSAACDGTPRKDGDALIGECRWVTVVPVLPGTCEATQLYNTCVHVPLDGGDCEAAQSCGQIGLGIYGRSGCDGTIEMIVVPPGEAFCQAPTDWPLCWPDDTSPECSCVCS